MPRGRPRGSSAYVTSSGGKIKGAMTAYSCFVKTCREEHKKLHPEENVQFGELTAQCAQRWKTMSDKEKEKFTELAIADKRRYEEQMKDAAPIHTDGMPIPRRRRRRSLKKDRDPNKPKRALSAFFYYAKDERPNVRSINPDFSVGEVAKELGRKWNELTEEQKSPYEKSAEEDRARYDVEMKAYRSGEMPAKKMKTSNGHAAPIIAPTEDSYDNGGDEDDDDDDEEDGDDE